MSAARGPVRHYGESLDLIRARIKELGIIYEIVDILAGLPQRYTAKCLCIPPKKRYSIYSLFSTLGALGLALQGIVDEALTERALNHPEFEKKKIRTRSNVLNAPRMMVVPVSYMRQLGLKGGAARTKSMTPKQRSKAARHAALARWAQARIAAAARL